MEYEITNLKTGTRRHVYKTCDVYECVEDIVGMEPTPFGVPYCIEAQSWAEIRDIGDVFEHPCFTVEIVG